MSQLKEKLEVAVVSVQKKARLWVTAEWMSLLLRFLKRQFHLADNTNICCQFTTKNKGKNQVASVHAINIGVVEVSRHSLLTSTLDGGKWSASRLSRFTTEEKDLETQQIWRRWGSKH